MKDKTEYFGDLGGPELDRTGVQVIRDKTGEVAKVLSPEQLVVAEMLVTEMLFVEKETTYPIRLSILSRAFSQRIKKVSPDDTCQDFVRKMQQDGLCFLKTVPTGQFRVVYSRSLFMQIRTNGGDIETHLGGMLRMYAKLKEPFVPPAPVSF